MIMFFQFIFVFCLNGYLKLIVGFLSDGEILECAWNSKENSHVIVHGPVFCCDFPISSLPFMLNIFPPFSFSYLQFSEINGPVG